METGSGSSLEAGRNEAHSLRVPHSQRIGGLGTALRLVLACFGRRREEPIATYHRPSSSALRPSSSHLQQPVEIILEIIGHLDPVASAAFSLSCKALWATIAHPTRLLAADQERLLLLLERDPYVGNGWYYCHNCRQLHPHLKESHYAYIRVPREGPRITPPFYPLCISNQGFCYGHCRPIMNRHFYSPPVGLPLDWLNTRIPEHSFPCRSVIKLVTREARIITDELFLMVKHELFPTRDCLSPETFRNAIDSMDISICSHVRSPNWEGFSCPTEMEPGIPEIDKKFGSLMFIPCHNIQRSCTLCPMDYETTVEFKEIRDGWPARDKNNNYGWVITVVSYFQLGSFRAPWDPPMLRHGYRDEAPGSVRQKWLSAGGN